MPCHALLKFVCIVVLESHSVLMPLFSFSVDAGCWDALASYALLDLLVTAKYSNSMNGFHNDRFDSQTEIYQRKCAGNQNVPSLNIYERFI